MPEETPEVVVPETAEEVTPEPEDDLNVRLQEESDKRVKAEEIAENQRIRAEKAEARAKQFKEAAKPALSSSDLLAVTNANIHEDDIERVERFAKSEGLSIKEALKHVELKAILDVRGEYRRSENAVNIQNVRAGNAQVSDEKLVQDASQGKFPDDDYGVERLVAAKAREYRG